MNEYVNYLDDLMDVSEMKCCLEEAHGIDNETANQAIVEWANQIAKRYAPKPEPISIALCHKCSEKKVQPDMLDERCHIIAGCKKMKTKEWESSAPCPLSGFPRM